MNSKPDPDQAQPKDEARYTDQEITLVHAQLEREKEEPREGFSPIPIIFLFFCSAFIFIGGVYIALPQHSGGFSAEHFDHLEYRPHGGEESGPIVAAAVDGARVYRANCLTCHMESGAGGGPYPPLAGSDWVAGSDQRLIRLALHGLQGPIEVNGQPYDAAMNAFGNLSDEQVAAVLTHIRSTWGNDYPEVLEETVTAVRAETAGRREPWTGPELEPYK